MLWSDEVITKYLPKEQVEYNTGYDFNFSGRQGGWVPATIKTVHHEDDGNGTPFTYIEILLYNQQTRRLYEPAIKFSLRHKL